MPQGLSLDLTRRREKAFVRNKQLGMDDVEAVVAAGYPKTNAVRQARKLLERSDIADAIGFEYTMQQLGITPRSILEPIALALQANTSIKVTKGRGKQRRESYVLAPDVAMRLRGAAIAWKIMQEDKNRNPFNTPSASDLPSEVINRLTGLDEVELAKLTFRKSSNNIPNDPQSSSTVVEGDQNSVS